MSVKLAQHYYNLGFVAAIILTLIINPPHNANVLNLTFSMKKEIVIVNQCFSQPIITLIQESWSAMFVLSIVSVTNMVVHNAAQNLFALPIYLSNITICLYAFANISRFILIKSNCALFARTFLIIFLRIAYLVYIVLPVIKEVAYHAILTCIFKITHVIVIIQFFLILEVYAVVSKNNTIMSYKIIAFRALLFVMIVLLIQKIIE